MKKILLSLMLLCVPLSAHAQGGPPGLNAANFISAGSSAADTTSANVTLGDATHITWVCGFSVSGLGATAAAGSTVTVGPVAQTSGATVNLTFEYNFVTGATLANPPTQQNFTPCLPVPGVATLTVGGAAGNTQTNLAIWGYKQ